MREEKTGRHSAVDEFKTIYRILFADVLQAEELLTSSATDFAIRTLVRTYFAYVEGVAYQLRQITLASLQDTGVLSAEERAILQGRKLKKLESGEIISIPSFQNMKDGLIFTLRCYAKNHFLWTYEPKFGRGWNSMVIAIQIRDRLMHPKSVLSTKLTADDVNHFTAARQWWHESVQELLLVCEDEDRRLRRF